MKRKRILAYMVLLIAVFALSGCGLIYTNIKTPMPTLAAPVDEVGSAKVGMASCESFLWIVATGDCSVNAALKNGKINKIHHVDTEIQAYVLGLYEKITTVVYGE
jgi:hypothetical protein